MALEEGFETARYFTLLHAVPCWASLGARRLDQVFLPQNLMSLILAGHNYAEGELAAERAALRYARPELQITRQVSRDVKD
ncbi:toprim domain-containing protein [Novosphingobium sp. G106]|uniref:toprim domain-containing protein n=1 Tax=Novosphingobium sp. G106 TaxID=2849500 RepID=UPI0020C26DC8|nr:toprim domain-containing protein [Novosphingobium sp. G106]